MRTCRIPKQIYMLTSRTSTPNNIYNSSFFFIQRNTISKHLLCTKIRLETIYAETGVNMIKTYEYV